MGVEKKMGLSSAGTLMFSMIKFTDRIADKVVYDIAPNFDGLDAKEQEEIRAKAKAATTTVVTGLLGPAS